MNKEKFAENLNRATELVIDFTKTLCYNNFSSTYKYIITPNSTTIDKDDKHLNESEILFLSNLNKNKSNLLSQEQVVDLLNQENTVPIWINISVCQSRTDLTVIDLLCSRRLREEKELMNPGIPPFHLQVATPNNFSGIEKDGKFDVNWRQHYNDEQKPNGILVKLKRLLTSLVR